MTVVFNPQTDFNYTENQNINVDITWTITLTAEELLEAEPNYIKSKTATISPTSTNIVATQSSNKINISGSFSLDDFNASIHYVDKGSSDKIQTPTVVSKYGLVPNHKEVFRINPIETSKTFVLTVTLKDKYDVSYIKTYNINIKINNTSISNWTKMYYQERY